jgi:hypothetical protein
LPQCGNWQKCNYVTTISLHHTMKTPRVGISSSNRHLLILDGHYSYVALQVVHKATKSGLDIVMLPSHTSHYLQPLDVAVFCPFKLAFRNLQDAWTLKHSRWPAQKEDLC